jgi:nitrite reductase/ring-hydroxylating ferredoxin subunit
MDFEKTIPSSELVEGGQVVVEVAGHSILLCRHDGQVHAVQNKCTHAGSRLESGLMAQGSIRCPLHGVRFDLRTGQCLNERLKCAALRCFAIREAEGHIEVETSTSLVLSTEGA